MSKILTGKGNLDSPVWFIEESPSTQDFESGDIFTGASGNMLYSSIKNCKEDASKFRYEYLNYNKIVRDFSTIKDDPEVIASIEGLKTRIKDYKPKIIVCFGSNVLGTITGQYDIDSWLGHVTVSEEFDCLVIGSYRATSCIRQRFVDKDEKPGQYEALFAFVIGKTFKTLHEGYNVPEYNIITAPSYREAKEYINEILFKADRIAFDIETIPFNVMDCISFAPSLTETISIPICIPQYRAKPIPYFAEDECVDILIDIKKLLYSDIPKVAQNSMFDTTILEYYYGMKVRNLVWDTMLAAHNLYCDLPKDLGTLTTLYSDMPYHKYKNKTGDIKDHWDYNAKDSLVTLHIMDGQIKEMKEMGVLDHYRNVTNLLVEPLRTMQVIGVHIDEPIRQHAINRDLRRMEEILFALDKVFPETWKRVKSFHHKFNPNSPQGKSNLFYDRFNCKRKYNKGRLTVDKKAMEFFQSDKRIYVSLLAKACRTYKAASSMAGKLKTPLLKGRIHSAYNIAGGKEEGTEDTGGTDTGRLSSSESILGSGTNLQNLSKGIQRQMLIPDEGYGFCVVDLWSAESFATALEGKETELLRMLNNGEKVHNWLMDATIVKFPEECKKLEYNYKLAKQESHAMNYGAEAPELSRNSKLPIHICEWQYAMYHQKFPGIKRRRQLVKDTLFKSRTLTSLLGRKRLFLGPYSNSLLNQACAWGPQSFIGEVTNIALTKIFYMGGLEKRLIKYTYMYPCLNTHDGIAIQYKLGEEEKVASLIATAFDIPVTKDNITINVPVEIGFGMNFNDIKDMKVIRK